MFTQQELKNILTEQRERLLKKEHGMERELLKRIEKKLLLPHVLVLTGMRRTGKSTLLRQIIRKYYSDEDFYYINFEDERFFGFGASEFNQLYENLLEVNGKKSTFFIDEIQVVEGFERFVRRFSEDGFKFIITGSSADLLSKELGTKLTGRHLDILVQPFSFQEYLDLNEVSIRTKTDYNTELRAEIKKMFETYLFEGGMPEYLKYKDPEILLRTYDDLVVKDIIVRHGITDVREIKELYSFLLANLGNGFSFSSLSRAVGIKSVNTIRKYITFLEETYFAKTINKFDYSLKKQIANDKKIYFIDNGFVNTLSKKATLDRGWLFENIAFNFVAQFGDVYYYSGKKECDFIIMERKQVKMAVQVCSELNASNKEREIEGLIEALETTNLKEGYLITDSHEEELVITGKKIHVRPLWKWLLEKNENI